MILDAGVLIAIDRGSKEALDLLAGSSVRDIRLHLTHPVLAQVWRHGGRQARLAAAIRSMSIHPFDDGRAVGQLLARTGTADPVDAHLVVLGAKLGEGILTGDVDDLRRLCGTLGAGAPRVYRWPPE